MIEIPVAFPAERTRLRRSIDADRGLSLRDRIRAIDGMLAAIDRLRAASSEGVDHGRLRRLRKEEVRRIFHEFIQRQLARADSAGGTAD